MILIYNDINKLIDIFNTHIIFNKISLNFMMSIYNDINKLIDIFKYAMANLLNKT